MSVQDGIAQEHHSQTDPVLSLPQSALEALEGDIQQAGGEYQEPPEYAGAVGRTMFDTPASEDNTVTILLPKDYIGQVPSQSIVRIKSLADNRVYLGVVVQGPFAEPDGLRADAPIVVSITVRGLLLPKYHGRVQVEIVGEEITDDDGNRTVIPPRYRPLPNSGVFVLDTVETAAVLKVGGDLLVGTAIGHDDIEVRIPSDSKAVLPRHLGILGTTGGGKSTTVAGLIYALQNAGTAVIVVDTEGEYTRIAEPTEDVNMLRALSRRNRTAEGVANTHIIHLVGRATANPNYQSITPISLQFSNLSPYAVMEILDLNEAQQARYLKAYDAAKRLLSQFKIYPSNEQEKADLLELDEMESGYPKMRLTHIYDVVRACAHIVAEEEDYPYFQTPEFFQKREDVMRVLRASELPSHVWSWRKVQGQLSFLLRLGIFDSDTAKSPNYAQLTQPGRVTLIDLSDTDSPQVNNLVIAEVLRGIQRQQEENYKATEKNKQPVRRVALIVEEAHEFLSAQRIKQMPVLFQQVARIARRGRKRWLSLCFVTQFPQHLPDEVLGLINNYILHKISDADVIRRLRSSIGGIDEGLWKRLPGLAPGQAVVSFTSMARALLTTVDPAPCKLRLVE